jgi:ribose transport system permease protein
MVNDEVATSARSAGLAEYAHRRTPLRLAEAWALVALTVALAVFFSLYPATAGTFLTAANLQALAGSQAVPLLVALAALVPLVCGEIDLSVGSAAGLCAVLAAYALGHGVPLPAALATAVAAGVVVGLTNGLLVTRAGVTFGVIATLGMAAVIGGVVLAVTDGRSLLFGIPTELTEFGSENLAGVPAIALASVAAACLVYYTLEHTMLGRQLVMLGSSRRAARLAGLRTDRLLLTSFAIAGGLAGLAGVLLLARVGGADPHAGPALTLPALAAAFLSAAAIRPGRYNAGGVVAAVSFLAVLNSGLNLAGSPPYLSEIVNGVALIAGVALATWLRRRRKGGAWT